MDTDLDEGIKGFHLSLEENEKVYSHVNGSSRCFLEGMLWDSVASGSVMLRHIYACKA